jgi:hypothetical protein
MARRLVLIGASAAAPDTPSAEEAGQAQHRNRTGYRAADAAGDSRDHQPGETDPGSS